MEKRYRLSISFARMRNDVSDVDLVIEGEDCFLAGSEVDRDKCRSVTATAIAHVQSFVGYVETSHVGGEHVFGGNYLPWLPFTIDKLVVDQPSIFSHFRCKPYFQVIVSDYTHEAIMLEFYRAFS